MGPIRWAASHRQLVVSCPCVPWKAQYLLLFGLLSKLLRDNSIVIPKYIAFHGHKDLCQSLDGSDTAACKVMTLLKCIKWLSGLESPLKCVKEGVENHFGGAACSISAVNGEEFTLSTTLHRASSKSPPIFKSQSRLFTSSRHPLLAWLAIHIVPPMMRASLVYLLVVFTEHISVAILPARHIGRLRFGHEHQIVGPTSCAHWSLDLISIRDLICFEQGSRMHVTYQRAEQYALILLLASCSTCLGPLELPVCALFHHSLFTMGSRAKVLDQIDLHEELSNQVVLVIYSLSELVYYEVEQSSSATSNEGTNGVVPRSGRNRRSCQDSLKWWVHCAL
ncbi:unnamed protein product [Prunus brigantina]